MHGNRPPADALEPAGLGDLLAHLADQAQARDAAADAVGLPRGAYPELAALDDFRRLWSRLRTEAQLRASMAPAPAGAGPLNSASLAHRALALMRAASPGYLRHFMAYLDALSWLEQMQADGILQPDEPPRPGTAGKRSRSRPRKPARPAR